MYPSFLPNLTMDENSPKVRGCLPMLNTSFRDLHGDLKDLLEKFVYIGNSKKIHQLRFSRGEELSFYIGGDT